MALRILSWIVPALLVAGCVEPPAATGDPAAAGTPAPRWEVGDWWTYRWDSEIYGFAFEATVVVGQAGNGTYGVGMDIDDYEPNALLFHLPAIGPLTTELAYDVHEVRFEPLAFPLQDGKDWETTYVAAPVHLTAHAANVTTPDGPTPGFRITNDGHEEAAGRHYRMEYAPAVGWFTLFERVELDGTLRERITLIDHGHGHRGTVRVPGAIEVLYLDARTAGTLGTDGLPALPLATFDPGDHLDLVFVACLYGDAPGAFHASVTAPSGAGCENTGTIAPGEPTHRRIEQHEIANEAGAWEVRLASGGQGLAIAEVLGYPAEDVVLA